MYTNGDVNALQEAENRLVEVYKPFIPKICEELNGWYIRVNPVADGGVWTPKEYTYTVDGLTYCEYGTIDIGHEDYRRNAYAHEVIHSVDCGKRDPNYQHVGWDEWQFHAIGEAHKY